MRVVMDKEVVTPIAHEIWGGKSGRRVRGDFKYKEWRLYSGVGGDSHVWRIEGHKAGQHRIFGPITSRRNLKTILGLVKTIADAEPEKRVICAVEFGKKQAENVAISIRYNRKSVRVEEAKLTTEKGLSLVMYAITAKGR